MIFNTPNEELATATIRGELRFVLTTTLCPQRKDTNNVFYHAGRTYYKVD